MSDSDKYANIYATLVSGDQQDSIEFSDEYTAYRFNLTPNSNKQLKLLKEFIPRFITLYEDKRKDGILLSTYSRSIFDNQRIQHVANEVVEMLKRNKERQSSCDDKSAETVSQLMLDLAQEREDQFK